MKTGGGSDEQKRRAGERAASEVTGGDGDEEVGVSVGVGVDVDADAHVIGLGTGSTAAHAIAAIGRAVDDGLAVRGIPTSYQSRQRAIDAGIPLTSLDEVDGIDLAIDGADQVAAGDLIKGGGAAHTREKVIAAAADRFVVVADPSKLAPRLERSVPVEVVPDARPVVADRVRDLEGEPTLRTAERKDGPVVTDNGNLVLDCAFGPIDDPAALAADLAAIPGVLEHGLFVGMADAVYVGTDDGVDVRRY